MSCGKGSPGRLASPSPPMSSLPQSVQRGAGQVEEPVVVAHHVERPHGDRWPLGRRVRLAQPGFRRDRQPVGGQVSQRRQRILVMRQDAFRNAGHQIQELVRMGAAPGPDRRPGVPLGRMHQVQDVAQQDEIEPLDGLVLAIASPGRGVGQRLQLPKEPCNGPGRERGTARPIGQVQVADDHQHLGPQRMGQQACSTPASARLSTSDRSGHEVYSVRVALMGGNHD